MECWYIIKEVGNAEISSVANSELLEMDPDPAFHYNANPLKEPDPDPGTVYIHQGQIYTRKRKLLFEFTKFSFCQ